MPDPPNKLNVLDLSPFTSSASRCSAISSAIVTFESEYGVYPQYVMIDSVVNAAYIGAYES